jgi:hypothetical protein
VNQYFALGDDCDGDQVVVHPVLDRTDSGGLQQLVAQAPFEEFVCSPGLGRAARKFGFRVEEVPLFVEEDFAALTFGIAGGRATHKVAELDVLEAFAHAAACFLRAQPWRLWRRDMHVRVRSVGTITREYDGRIFGAHRDISGLTLYMSSAPAVLSKFFPANDPVSDWLDSISMIPEGMPPFAARVLKRNFGLEVLPVPKKVVGSELVQIHQAEMTVLAATLMAAAGLTSKRRKNAVEIDLEEVTASVEVEIARPIPVK